MDYRPLSINHDVFPRSIGGLLLAARQYAPNRTFTTNGVLETIMKVSGNIQAGTTASYSDDGVSQKTTIKSGVQRADVIVPNPVKLVPYRTFSEVESDVGIRRYVLNVMYPGK